MFEKIFQKSKKGSVLVYVLLFMFIMLAIVLDLIASSVSEEKNAIISTSTDLAIASAEEGIEDFISCVNTYSRENNNPTTIKLTYSDTHSECDDSSGIAVARKGLYTATSGLAYTVLNFYRRENDGNLSLINNCDTSVIEVVKINSTGYFKNTVRSVSAPVSFFSKGLMGYWRLNDGSGGTAEDFTLNNEDGIVFGNKSWDVSQKAFNFDGTNYIKIGDDDRSGLFGFRPTLTLVALINPDVIDNSGSDIISLGDHVGLRIKPSGHIEGFWHTPSCNTADIDHCWCGTVEGNNVCWEWFSDNSYPASMNNWYQFAFVINPLNSREKLYINGNLVEERNSSNLISYSGLGEHAFLGKHGNGSSFFDFNGLIREARIYDRALTDTEIKMLYNASR